MLLYFHQAATYDAWVINLRDDDRMKQELGVDDYS